MNLDENKIDDLGIVYKKTKGFYTVHTASQMLACTLSSHLRKGFTPGQARPPHRMAKGGNSNEHSDLVAVGDMVRLSTHQHGTGVINEVLPRRNRLARRAAVSMPGAHAFEQVIVANVDQVVPVFAAVNPPPRWNMLDRYLAAAESFNLPALVCITKLDLTQSAGSDVNEELLEEVNTYCSIGYRVILTSTVSGEGLAELKEALNGRISVFVGKSGVGKSALLNTLQPGLGLRVKEVSQLTGKGRHTTTHLEMFPLVEGGAIVDTPGTREFGLWEIGEDELAMYFPEMRPFVGRCKFGLDCQHDEEPGCAIRKAVMQGEISPRRYKSYMRLREDAHFV